MVVQVVIVSSTFLAAGVFKTGTKNWCYPSPLTTRLFSRCLCSVIRSHYGPWVDSGSDRNEYQEYLLGVKVAGA